nr:hypothetical protein [Deltaproteobacteria bacterium]
MTAERALRIEAIVSLLEVKNVRSKTWFLIAACAVIALALGFWWSMGKKEEPRQEALVVQKNKTERRTSCAAGKKDRRRAGHDMGGACAIHRRST